MDPQLMQLLRGVGGGDGELQSLLQQLARRMEEDPEAARVATEEAAREIGGDVVGAIQALAQATGAGGGGGREIGAVQTGAGGGGSGQIRVGDRVRIRDDVEMNRRLAAGHGGWNPAMANVCGETGECTRIDHDGDVHVRFSDGQTFCWNPACVEGLESSGFDTSWHAGLNTPPPFAPWRLECYRLKYAAELEALAERGFPEVGPGVRALVQNRGDVDMAAALIESAQVAAHAARSVATPASPSAKEEEKEAKPTEPDSDEILRAAIAMSLGEGENGGAEREPEPGVEREPDSASDFASEQETGENPEFDRNAWLAGLTLSPGDSAPPQLCEAVLAGDSDTVKRYLEEPGSSADLWFVSEDVPEPECFSLLAVAAVEGHVDICRMLADANIDQLMRGATALQLAAWAGQLETVKLLHERGARVDYVSMEQPAGTAVRSYRVTGAGSREVNGTYRPVTLPSYAGAQPYTNGTITMFRWQQEFWALSNLGTDQDDFDEIRWLYSCQANSEVPPMAGWTAFCGAQPPPNIAETTTRTEPPSRPAVGRMGTPLWLAATAGHAEVCKWLLLNGAPVESVGPNGDTALKVAERNTTRALCSAVFVGAKFWAQASLRDAKEVFESDAGEVRHDVVCDRSGVDIVGSLYHLRGFNYDLCEAEYIKLSDSEKAKYECIMRPPKLLFDSDLRQLCESQQRTDLCDFIGLRDESLRVRACQRLAWATHLISDWDCVVGELDIDTVSRVAVWTNRLKRSSASFNLKVIQEESRTSGVSSINLKRLRSVERQLMPGGINEIHDMLETAGLTRPDAITALLDAVQAVARDQRPSLEGLYKCTQRNGVAIRYEPKEGTKTTTGPSFGNVVAVETLVRVRTEQSADPAQAVERDIAAALSQLGAALGEDTVRDMLQEMQSLAPSDKLSRLLAMGFSLELPSASPAAEIEYLKLVGGGYCPMKLPRDTVAYFQRQGAFAESGDPMDSPALSVCAARTVAQGEQLDGLTLCEWRRFQRFAVAWPGRPERLSSTLPPEVSTLPALLVSAKLDEYTTQLSALGLELGDCPFISTDDLASAIPKEFHRKRLRRVAQRLPLEPARAASAEDVTHLTASTSASAGSHHLLGNTAADTCFQVNCEKFRRMRQLADGSSEELEAERRRRGKFCGKFSRGSARAEINKARESPLWNRTLRGPLDVRAKIDALWDGEFDLETLQRGLGADGARLMELILNAEDDLWDEEVARKLHDDEPHNSGEGSAQRFFDSNIVHLTRIRQLADPARAMSVQPRFNQNGYEDERNFVRSHYVPVWKQLGWDVGKPIERLWQGERALEVLSLGCDANTAELVELLLAADDNTEEANRRHQAAHERLRRQTRDDDGTGHAGEWRGEQYQQWCSAPGREEGPLCAHLHRTSGIVHEEHWSCCGVTDRRANCPLSTSTLTGSNAAVNMRVSRPGSGRHSGPGTLLGWKVNGARFHDTSGGLASDGYCRVDFDNGGAWNVPMAEVSPLAAGGGHRLGGGSAVSTARDCRGGHGLTDSTTPRTGFGCDICHRDLPEGTRVHSCRQCNHDVCHECFEANLSGGGSADGGDGDRGTGTGGISFDTAVVGQLVEHGRRKAELLGFRCDRRGGLNGDTSKGCQNADGACRLRYHDTGERFNVMHRELTFVEAAGGGGVASPAAALGTVIADDDPVVLQLVAFGFQASQAKFAMMRGREQGIRASHMVEACTNFILEHPIAGVPPRLQDGSLICPDGHVLNPIPNVRYDTVCDVCHSHETHHICQAAQRHYDVCVTCFRSALEPTAASATSSTTTESEEPTITIVGTPPPRNPAATAAPVVQESAARESRLGVSEEAVPPPAAAQAPTPAATPGGDPVAAPQTPDEDREAVMRAARLARFG